MCPFSRGSTVHVCMYVCMYWSGLRESSPVDAPWSVSHLIREVGQVVDDLRGAPQDVVELHKTLHCLTVPVYSDMGTVTYWTVKLDRHSNTVTFHVRMNTVPSRDTHMYMKICWPYYPDYQIYLPPSDTSWTYVPPRLGHVRNPANTFSSVCVPVQCWT